VQKRKNIEDDIIDIYENKLKDFQFSSDEIWAIYGTGNGAEIVLEILKRWKLEKIIRTIVDNDEVSKQEIYFHNIRVINLYSACKFIDGIIIASMDFHEIVYKRVQSFIDKHFKSKIKVINLFAHNTRDEIHEYINYIENCINRRDEELYEDFETSPIELQDNDTKVIAWYLPQFHRIDVNDYYYGRGFTEWTNTSRAIPMFTGHYQPHIPYDVGYYDLHNPEVFLRQIELAKHYGIFGFSFYYYWFSGKRIMEKPLEYFLRHPELDIKYCITWANENWTALWDGGNNDLIFEQKLKNNDAVKFIDDLLPYFADNRYIRINNKLLLIVYRPTVWKKDFVKKIFQNFREEMQKKGMGELYIMICNARGFNESVEDWGADALVEFPPHGIGEWTPIIRVNGYLNPHFVGHIRSTDEFITGKKYLCKHNCSKYFRGAMPSWDNTARKAHNGATIYTGLTPNTFQQWMQDIIYESKKIHSKEENIVFVNAWNEWAEGTHLEPDMKYGYANLKAIKKAIEQNRH
jgi:hypothetical protein